MFQLINPSHKLSDIISTFWLYKNTSGKTEIIPVFPDGCTDIIFQLEKTEVVGCMTKSQKVITLPSQTMLGIRFKPGRAFAFLHAPMNELTDKTIDITLIRKGLNQYMKDTSVIEDTISHIEQYLLTTEQKFDSKYKKLLLILDAIISMNGAVSICPLAKEYDLSVRNLERYFKEVVGITPKMFARIIRFQRAYTLMTSPARNDLISIALLTGYYDQAHFTHEFTEFTGNSPSHFFLS